MARTVDWFVANEAWWRAARDRATGTPTTSASTGRACRSADLMRVAVTGASGRLGSALVTALADAPFTGPAGPGRLDARWTSTSTIPRRRSTRSWTASGRRSSSTRRRGPTSTAAPATRRSPSGATAIATGVLAIACAPTRPGPARRVDQRGLRRRPRRRAGLRARRAACAGQSVRCLQGPRRTGRDGGLCRVGTARGPRHRPDRLAVRPARPRLPAEDRGGGASRRGRPDDAPGRRRRVGLADLRRGRRRRHRRAAGRGRRTAGPTTSSTPGSPPAPTGPAMSSRGSASP